MKLNTDATNCVTHAQLGFDYFVSFPSHRAREYGLRALDRHPKSYFSFKRKLGHGGTYRVSKEEIDTMRAYSKHARFSIVKNPYDLQPCWTF